jgi:predicted nucleic acid-binding protein
MDRVVLDTDVCSLSLKRRLPPQVLARLAGKQPCVTFVTLGELAQWAELRQWGRRNRDALEHWLGGMIVLPGSEDVARTWGRISAAAIGRGRVRPANDTWIAACALAYGLPLATLNAKDFADFGEHDAASTCSSDSTSMAVDPPPHKSAIAGPAITP